MDYIINPSWFYWLSVAEATKIVSFIIAGIAMLVTVVFMIGMLENIQYGEQDEDYIRHKKIFKIFIAVAIVFFVAGILIPSRQTLIEMMVAKFATYENARLTEQAIKDAVDYIISAVKGG